MPIHREAARGLVGTFLVPLGVINLANVRASTHQHELHGGLRVAVLVHVGAFLARLLDAPDLPPERQDREASGDASGKLIDGIDRVIGILADVVGDGCTALEKG